MIASELRKLLHYDPESGLFTWIAEKRSGVPKHRIAGCVHSKGYVHIVVMRKLYKAHRLAWLYMTGEWPKDQIDHINMIRSDNRYSNLREATGSINQQNKQHAMATSSTGLLGAFKHGKKFCARIRVDGMQRYLGQFNSPELAHAAYMRAKRIYHEGYVS